MLVVAREVPGDERRVSAEPDPEQEDGRQRQRPPQAALRERALAPRLAHAGLEPRGQLRSRQAQKPRAQLPLGLSLRAARRTGLEVRGHFRRQPLRQLPVHETGDALGIAGHADPFGRSASRSSARPRWMRDITVPTGTPSASAISA